MGPRLAWYSAKEDAYRVSIEILEGVSLEDIEHLHRGIRAFALNVKFAEDDLRKLPPVEDECQLPAMKERSS